MQLLPEEPDEVGLGAEFALELGGEHLSLPLFGHNSIKLGVLTHLAIKLLHFNTS